MDAKTNKLEAEAEALRQIIALGDAAFDLGMGIPAKEIFADLWQKKGIDA